MSWKDVYSSGSDFTEFSNSIGYSLISCNFNDTICTQADLWQVFIVDEHFNVNFKDGDFCDVKFMSDSKYLGY